jgi:hypothetical protein
MGGILSENNSSGKHVSLAQAPKKGTDFHPLQE